MDAPEGDRGRMVAINADKCSLCAQTMHIFTAAYGAEAGVAALKWLPTGGALAECYSRFFALLGLSCGLGIPYLPNLSHTGLYLTGGLTPKNIDYIRGTKPGTEGLFMGALLDKVRPAAAPNPNSDV